MSKHAPRFEDRELLKLLESGKSFADAAKALGCAVALVRERVRKYVDCGVVRKRKSSLLVDWKVFEQWQKIRQTLAGLDGFLDKQSS